MTSSGDHVAEVPVRPDDEDEQDRGAILGWIYLGVILAVFTAMALWAYNLNDGDGTASVVVVPPTSSPTTTEAPSLAGAQVDVVVDRNVATLTGSVPDEGARNQLVRIAQDQFGRGNVVDELTIDDGVDLASGVINISGIADEGDDAPELLQLTAGADLGLAPGAFDLNFVAPRFDPAMIEIAVAEVPVLITGVVPDESVQSRILQSAEQVYGEGNVDITGLTISPSTMEDATISITGLTAPGDVSSQTLAEIAQQDFTSAAVSNDTEVDVSEQALADLEEQLRETIRENPILFAVGTSSITPEGQANLVEIAEIIQAIPDLGVEVIGHTDNTGGDVVNQTLSENRAASVKEALVDLGIAENRLTAIGRGASEPEVPNTSADNRARNRRIEFVFERV